MASADDMTEPSMWRRTDMRRALARHDLKTVFRLMQRYGISQRQIAALTGLAQSDVSIILCGRRKVIAYAVLERVAEGLELPRGWLGLAYDDQTLALQQPPPQASMHAMLINRPR